MSALVSHAMTSPEECQSERTVGFPSIGERVRKHITQLKGNHSGPGASRTQEPSS